MTSPPLRVEPTAGAVNSTSASAVGSKGSIKDSTLRNRILKRRTDDTLEGRKSKAQETREAGERAKERNGLEKRNELNALEGDWPCSQSPLRTRGMQILYMFIAHDNNTNT